MRTLILALAAIATAVPVAARDQAVPDAAPAGAAVDCITLNQIRETHVRSDQVIDFEVAGKRMYRNTLDSACPNLGFEQRFSYSVTGGRLCSTDTVTVLQSTGTRGATCGLGKFQPVTLAK